MAWREGSGTVKGDQVDAHSSSGEEKAARGSSEATGCEAYAPGDECGSAWPEPTGAPS